VRADVAKIRGAEERVDQRVGDDVAVGVPRQPRLAWKLDPSEDERHAGVEGVGVDADPDPEVRHRVPRAGRPRSEC